MKKRDDGLGATDAEVIADLRESLAEMEASFDLRWKADMRAIQHWRVATGLELIWPDHADLCSWLMGRLGECEAEIERLKGSQTK